MGNDDGDGDGDDNHQEEKGGDDQEEKGGDHPLTSSVVNGEEVRSLSAKNKVIASDTSEAQQREGEEQTAVSSLLSLAPLPLHLPLSSQKAASVPTSVSASASASTPASPDRQEKAQDSVNFVVTTTAVADKTDKSQTTITPLVERKEEEKGTGGDDGNFVEQSSSQKSSTPDGGIAKNQPRQPEQQQQQQQSSVQTPRISPNSNKTKTTTTTTTWEEFYERLVLFQKEHGHCRPQLSHRKESEDESQFKRFVKWVSYQRSSFAKRLDDDDRGRGYHSMSPIFQQRFDRLNALGFHWSVRGIAKTVEGSTHAAKTPNPKTMLPNQEKQPAAGAKQPKKSATDPATPSAAPTTAAAAISTRKQQQLNQEGDAWPYLFPIGTKLERYFHSTTLPDGSRTKAGYYQGEIRLVKSSSSSSKQETLYSVVYTDGDEEDLDHNEVIHAVHQYRRHTGKRKRGARSSASSSSSTGGSSSKKSRSKYVPKGTRRAATATDKPKQTDPNHWPRVQPGEWSYVYIHGGPLDAKLGYYNDHDDLGHSNPPYERNGDSDSDSDGDSPVASWGRALIYLDSPIGKDGPYAVDLESLRKPPPELCKDQQFMPFP